MRNPIAGFFTLIFALICAPISHAQTIVNQDDRGWYNPAGNHTPSNNNTFTGLYNGTQYRSYLRFPIPASASCVQSASFELELERYYGNGSGHTLTLYDISAANVANIDLANGGGNGAAIHTDMGGGVSYGSQGGITSALVGTVLTFALPASALADMAAAAGGDFAIGLQVSPSGGGNLRALRFSTGHEARTHRIIYTDCPLMPNLTANKDVAVYDPLAQGLYATPGNDAIYTINVTNSGAGAADTDSMVIIDKLPPETIFYNGDIDDAAGPETDPVAFAQAGAGLSFAYGVDAAFSNGATAPANFAACTYTPNAGYDASVTYICLNPKGAMAAGPPDSTFDLSFRVRIK